MKSEIDQLVVQATRDFVRRLDDLNEEPFIREAIMKMAVREVGWAMLQTFGDKGTLVEQLKMMAEVLEDHNGP
jgi:hypothetical protein